MADVKTHLRELSVATTIELLKNNIRFKRMIYTIPILNFFIFSYALKEKLRECTKNGQLNSIL